MKLGQILAQQGMQLRTQAQRLVELGQRRILCHQDSHFLASPETG